MISITCTADVIKAFPDASVGSDGIFYKQGKTYIEWDERYQEMRIDGELTAAQIVALAYWVTHRTEFPTAVRT